MRNVRYNLFMANSRKTHCVNGHERITSNVSSNGTCKTCDLNRANARNLIPAYSAKRAAKMRDYYANLTPEQRMARNKKAVERAPRYKQYQKKWLEDNYERLRALHRTNHLRRTYGMTQEEFDKMFSGQSGRCAICFRSNGIWHIDHDHCTGKVRGILCHSCNLGLGRFSDSVEHLRSAIAYLEKRTY